MNVYYIKVKNFDNITDEVTEQYEDCFFYTDGDKAEKRLKEMVELLKTIGFKEIVTSPVDYGVTLQKGDTRTKLFIHSLIEG